MKCETCSGQHLTADHEKACRMTGEIDDVTITCTRKEYERLVKDSEILSFLEGAGVENWEGYADAMELVKNEDT